MPERLLVPQTPVVTSSPLQPKPFPIAEAEAPESRSTLPLRDQLKRARRLGPKFKQIPILSPERSEPDFSSMIQRSAATGVLLGGGALTGASTTATGTAATGGLAAGSGVSGGLVLVGGIAVGGTVVLGVYALGAMTRVPTGDPETWPKPDPQPGPPPQAPDQRLKLAPLPAGHDPSMLPTYRPEQLGMTQAEAMEFVSQESIPAQSPTGIREDLIPMTGDLPGGVEGIPMEQPGSQVLGEDPVQVPGAHDPLTTPMAGPQLPQVESFPDAELDQLGEAEAESPSEREARALERAIQAANWGQVKDYIGQPVSAGLPPGYTSRDKGGGELVRQIRDDNQQVPLQVDENGLIQLRVGSSNRISNPYQMKKNFTQVYGEIEEGFWSHHVIPDEVVQRARLARFAHEQGWYDLDRSSNQLGMPDRETYEEIRSGQRPPVNRPGHTDAVGHWSSHDKYSRRVETHLQDEFRDIQDYFGVRDLGDIPQERMEELKDIVMDSIKETEDLFRDLIHDNEVETKDGRLSWRENSYTPAT